MITQALARRANLCRASGSTVDANSEQQAPVSPTGSGQGEGQPLYNRFTRIDLALTQKNERPVGVPAALAWGMEGTTLEDQSASGLSEAAGRSTALTSRRTTHRSNIATIIGSSDRYFKGPTSFPTRLSLPEGPVCVSRAGVTFRVVPAGGGDWYFRGELKRDG